MKPTLVRTPASNCEVHTSRSGLRKAMISTLFHCKETIFNIITQVIKSPFSKLLSFKKLFSKALLYTLKTWKTQPRIMYVTSRKTAYSIRSRGKGGNHHC